MKALLIYILFIIGYAIIWSGTTPNKPIQSTQPIFEYEGHINDLKENTVLLASYNKDTNTYYLNIKED